MRVYLNIALCTDYSVPKQCVCSVSLNLVKPIWPTEIATNTKSINISMYIAMFHYKFHNMKLKGDGRGEKACADADVIDQPFS